jgi:isoleucyl-tRNA synthetase
VTLSKLLAPFMPFLAEELYGNLVCSVSREAPESVHLAGWPETDPSRVDEALNREMALVMKLASLGHAARNEAGIKVRQPLAEAAFALPGSEEAGMLERHASLLVDELNVRQVRLLGSAGEAISYSLNPLPKQLGQKYRGRLPAVRSAILALDPEPAARSLLAGEPVRIDLEGEALEILPDEVEVRASARAGLAVASEGPYLCALKTELTPELELEGLAREFVRRVQDMRKTAGLEIADRICLWAGASPRLAQAITAHLDYLKGETLAVKFEPTAPPEGVPSATAEFDGERVEFGVEKVGEMVG